MKSDYMPCILFLKNYINIIKIMLLKGEAFIQWRTRDNFPWVADIVMEAIFSNVYEVHWTKIVVIASERI